MNLAVVLVIAAVRRAGHHFEPGRNPKPAGQGKRQLGRDDPAYRCGGIPQSDQPRRGRLPPPPFAARSVPVGSPGAIARHGRLRSSRRKKCRCIGARGRIRFGQRRSASCRSRAATGESRAVASSQFHDGAGADLYCLGIPQLRVCRLACGRPLRTVKQLGDAVGKTAESRCSGSPVSAASPLTMDHSAEPMQVLPSASASPCLRKAPGVTWTPPLIILALFSLPVLV